jgi:hypothetical protein
MKDFVALVAGIRFDPRGSSSRNKLRSSGSGSQLSDIWVMKDYADLAAGIHFDPLGALLDFLILQMKACAPIVDVRRLCLINKYR